MRINVSSVLLLAGALLTLAPTTTSAQAGFGTITGTVRDTSGAEIPGATVRVLHNDRPERAQASETVTDAQGGFTVSDLAPGPYRIEAGLDGFETASNQVSVAAGQTTRSDAVLSLAHFSQTVVVTARRREEAVQEVPIPVSVVRGDLVADAGAFNVNRLKEMLPTVQFYSTNPRNSSINIRGLGAPFGLTNDGIEPGVGLYIDGVFYARPAAATTDFLDVEQVEVLRGPQGTLFGKNTTAGAINITTRRPSFTRGSEVELNTGSYGFVQAKASVTGSVFKHTAARLSFSGTSRGGVLHNTRTGEDLNDLDNLGVRGQVLFAPSDALAVTFAADYSRQRVRGNTQMIAGVAPTLRPANRQFAQIAADLGYTPPSVNAFDRVTDIDTALRSNQDLGGASLTIERKVRAGRVVATTAHRFWDWKPSNDRDFTGLSVTSVSAAPSFQTQWTQEVRYTTDPSSRLHVVTGAFLFRQAIDSDPAFVQEQGSAAARFLLAPSTEAATPGLLDGYGFRQSLRFRGISAAAFGQVEWAVSDRLRVMPGVRLNYDQKTVDFDQQVYGGLQTSNPRLLALQRSVLAPQAYATNVDDTNLSGQVTTAYRIASPAHGYATYATSFKSIGLNLNGVPMDAEDRPVLSAATVKPEDVRHMEVGLKTEPFGGVTTNLALFQTTIDDFQAQVVDASVGVLRGYLANADRVRVRGLELDASASLGRRGSLYAAAALTDGRYVSFPNAPPPVEETGGPAVKDVSGSLLPGISKTAISVGGEVVAGQAAFGHPGQFFGAIDTSYRSSFSSSASASRYLIVDGYTLVNGRVGFRARAGWTVSLWARNLFNTNYFDLLSAAPGNTGLIVGQPGDPRTVGVTLRLALRSK